MCAFSIRSLLLLAGLCGLALSVSSCDDDKPAAPKPAKKIKRARPMDKPLAGLSAALEEFTGGHTRLVWTEHPRRKSADTFADSNLLVLKGIDSRDGNGERMLQRGLDNYSRPLLSHDGTVILFTDKEVTRKKGRKNYDPDIYRTDWAGTKPRRIAAGYAVDCWRDPATGAEWVYAARDFRSSSQLSMTARRLARFRLEDPGAAAVLYEESAISPDNIQLSRNGARASCLFPWPSAGVLVEEGDEQMQARRLLTGCWPSLAPDNSGVAWVFDGSHRQATFFSADGQSRWTVRFNDAPGTKGHEMYHPRWSNHPRFFAITGPYVPVKGQKGNVISKGGGTADVFIGRFNEKLDAVEAWLRVTDDDLSESYPDLWIEGGAEEELAAFAQQNGGRAKAEKPKWPAADDALAFLWPRRDGPNQFHGKDGRRRASAALTAREAGRIGRLEEMRVDGGRFEIEPEDGDPLEDALESPEPLTVEMVLLPEARQPEGAALRPVFISARLLIAVNAEGRLVVADETRGMAAPAPLPRAPFHLAVERVGRNFSAFVNGEALVLSAAGPVELPLAPPVAAFGGGWSGGILGAAIHRRALSLAELKRHSAAQNEMLAALPPPPPRVVLTGRLVECSAMPTAEGIAPYTSALAACVYEVEKVSAGPFQGSRVLVKHWAMLDRKPVAGLPREIGRSYELQLESEAHHLHLKGERVMDDTTAFDLEPWFDTASPQAR